MYEAEKALDPAPLGIIGDGQLGMYLAQAARAMGRRVYLWPPDSRGPAADFADALEPVPADLDAFAASCAWIAIENEHQALELSPKLSVENRKKLRPSPEALATLADKGSQKQLLQRLGIATAPFDLFKGEAVDLEAWLQKQACDFPSGFVLKWTRGGYDGRGVKICRHWSAAVPSEALAFASAALAHGSAVYAEEMIAFQQEVALVASRSRTGDISFLPLVITEQNEGICQFVRGPAASRGLSDAYDQTAQKLAATLAQATDLVGTFALEFFLTAAGQLLVNEVAPRVHNSGHFSLAMGSSSQFAQHWRAILGMEFGTEEAPPSFAMINILGPKGYKGKARAFTAEGTGSQVYWYGKSQLWPGRKMGHINIWGNDDAEVERSIKILESKLDAWRQSYSEQGESL